MVDMKELSQWTPALDAHFADRFVLACDLDDTLTHGGELPAFVHEGLELLRAKGWVTVLVTGRPAGWAEALIKLMPFDAVVGENGALFYFWPGGRDKRGPNESPQRYYFRDGAYVKQEPDPKVRAHHEEARKLVLAKFPRVKVASDQSARLYDIALDFAEEIDPPMSLADAEEIAVLLQGLGAQAKVSSIHVNAWWGPYTKVDALREVLAQHFKADLVKHVVYAGDSPNDAPLFKAAGVSVGVANVKKFFNDAPKASGPKPLPVQTSTTASSPSSSPRSLSPLPDWAPHYVTPSEGSRGARELMEHLLARGGKR